MNAKNSNEKISFLPYTRKDLKDLMKEAIEEIQGNTTKKETNEEDDFLTQREAAKFLNVSLPTIIKWKQKEKIPYYQQGRTILFKKSELLDAMRKNNKLIK